jgi:MoaA/NifB/PqqE/SkfB family radical SAM enzyme
MSHVAERLSFRQRMNLIKCGIDILLQLDRARGLPPTLIIETTNVCNLDCPLCPSGEGSMDRPRGLMSFDTFQEILDALGEVLIFVYLHCWGEPFLNKEMARMIEACTDRNILTLCSTNGHYLQTLDDALKVVDAGLTKMIIAMDG